VIRRPWRGRVEGTPDNELGARRTDTADQSPQLKITLAYINYYINGYGQPWTCSDLNRKMRHDPGQPQIVAGCCLRLRYRRLSTQMYGRGDRDLTPGSGLERVF
jgi:hypothetical protein